MGRCMMPVLENGLKGTIITGLAVGIGVALVAPVVIPVLASVAKPLAKALIKNGLVLFEKGKEAAAELGEGVEDRVAESKAEMAETQKEVVAAEEERGA